MKDLKMVYGIFILAFLMLAGFIFIFQHVPATSNGNGTNNNLDVVKVSDGNNDSSREAIRVNKSKDMLVRDGGDYYLIRNIKDSEHLVNDENRVKFTYDGKELEGEFVSVIE